MVLALKPVHLAMPLCLVRKRHVAGAWFFGRRVLHIYIYVLRVDINHSNG